MDRQQWADFVDASEQRTLTLTLEERNLISDAAAHIDWLESRKKHSEGHVTLLRKLLTSIRSILVRRNQPGWEQNLVHSIDVALEDTKV